MELNSIKNFNKENYCMTVLVLQSHDQAKEM